MLSNHRALVALGVAVFADLLQLPLTTAFIYSVMSGLGITLAAPIETIDISLDLVTFAIETWLLGFHWMLLPTVFLEAVPLLDVAPTWTLCVWWVVRSRRNAMKASPPIG
jgi:hypothetical protein